MPVETLRESLEPHIDPELGHHRPNGKHYFHGYRWDETQISKGYSATGEFDLAVQCVEQVLSWQNTETGFIPNIKLTPHRWIDPERWTFKRPLVESSYPQPPFEAEASVDAYELRPDEGREFYRRNYPALKLGYQYFSKYLENTNSHIIGVFHPSSLGRDSGPDSDKARPGRIPTWGKNTPRIVYAANTVIDYLSSLALNVRLRAVNWDPEKARKIFWMNDVMFNCIYANNLNAMGKIAGVLGEEEDKSYFLEKSQAVSDGILTELWNEKTGFFHSLDKSGQPIPDITIGNLYAITLPGLNEVRTGGIVDVMKDPKWFGTKNQFPSVPANSRYYDPSRKEKRLWRGPTWLNTNLHLLEGLKAKAIQFRFTNPRLANECWEVASNTAKTIVRLVEDQGPWECYDSETGEGLRLKPFAWSKAAYHTVLAKHADLLAA